MLLATRPIVFIGYSLRDHDFRRIYDLLKREMKGLLPHAYMVTLDKESATDLDSAHITPIVTDATYFVHVLKQRLVDERSMVADERFAGILDALDLVTLEHDKLHHTLNCRTNPDIIYASSYQDGLMHSLEGIIARRRTGYCSDPGNIVRAIRSYEVLRSERLRSRQYFDVAYIVGYITGLEYFLCDDETRSDLPLYWAFGIGHIDGLDDYTDSLQHASEGHKAARAYAQKIAKRATSPDTVFHHPPFL